jgi:Tol biopolymer transport system component
VLYEIATGQRPYTSSLQGKLIDEILHHPAAPPSSANRKLPLKLDEIILKCLEKNPENRYQTAKEIAVDLRRTSAPTSGQVSVPKQHSKANLWAIGVLTAVLMAAAMVWYLLPTAQPRLTGSKRLTESGHALADAIAADSSGVYFNTGGLNSTTQINQVSLNGGETTEFRNAIPNAAMLDVSQDHSQLLAMSGGEFGHDMTLWALLLPGGSPRRLADIKADWWGARWSPDMKSLVFIRGTGLWLANSDGTDPRRIASVEGEPFRPAFSPDGKRIRFSVRNLTSSIWEVRVDGSNLHQILPAWHKVPHECCGIWTPDGRYYVFRSASRNDWLERFGFGDLYVVPDSSGVFHRSPSVPVQLTFGPLAYALGGFAPDGNKLLVSANDPRPELMRYDFNSRKLVPFFNIVGAQYVAFSQDGKRITYVKTSDDTLWISGADGSNRFQLTYPPDRANLPRWSPDGTKIAFGLDRLGKRGKLVVISSEGGTAEELIPGETSEGDPSWSNDGTRIVFSAESDIRIVDLKTRQVSQVPGSAGKFSPRWSPNGGYLAALESGNGSKKLYLFDFRSGKWSDWLTDADGIGYPTWTPDSRYVRYRTSSSCKRIRVGDSHPEVLFSLKGFVEYTTTSGSWSDVAPDGSWMFIHDASTQDIYALDVNFP